MEVINQLIAMIIYNVGIAITNHPPFITIFMADINLQKLGWFMTLLYPH